MSNTDSTGSLYAKTGPRQPLRLLEIVGNAIVGGVESYVRNLISGLPAEEYEVSCILPFESAYTASLRAMGCKVYITPIQDDPLWRSIEMATEVVRQNQIDVIHANLANAHTLAGIVGRMTNTPAVATVHSRSLWIQELSVSRLANMNVITVCQEAYAQALATGLPIDKLSLIPNGVDIERFDPARSGAGFRESLGLSPDTLLVGFVGRLAKEKGPDKFVQVASRIRQRLPDVHFVMVGDGPVEGDIRALVAETGMEDRLHLAGLRRDVENVYPALDLLIQTSRSEAMPLALLEAMASGVPVVAIAVGGVAELVEAGTTGILVSPGDWPGVSSAYPGDWEGIAFAASDLLQDPKRLAVMGRAARERIEKHFDLANCVQETSALFQSVARPSVLKSGAWRTLPKIVAGKGDGERTVRIPRQDGEAEPDNGSSVELPFKQRSRSGRSRT